MQIRNALPRAALIILAALVLFGLFWWFGDRKVPPDQDEILVVPATASPKALPTAPPPAGTDSAASDQVEKQILQAIGEPGASLRNVRIVDQERQIACGERISQGSATVRRFVWLSQVRQVVTDDGGPDFAILLHVCDPPPSPQN